MTLFDASRVDVEQMDDLNALVIVLSETPDGEGNRLEIQRALVSDPQDAETGTDTYCLCSPNGATYYGGILSWSVNSDRLSVVLDQSAAEALGLPTHVHIGLHVTDDKKLLLRANLHRAIDGDKTSI
jgi:hypothetical protein